MPFETVFAGEMSLATHDTLRLPKQLAAAEGCDATLRRLCLAVLKQRAEEGVTCCLISTWARARGFARENSDKLIDVSGAPLVHARIAERFHSLSQRKHVRGGGAPSLEQFWRCKVGGAADELTC
jgi:hypothetical protein